MRVFIDNLQYPGALQSCLSLKVASVCSSVTETLTQESVQAYACLVRAASAEVP